MTPKHPHTLPVSRAFNAAVWTCANGCLRRGWDVDDRQSRTLESLTDELRSTGRLTVWKGASDRTIFADPETNYAFRAWHDYHHVKGQFPMTPGGERCTAEAQVRDLVKLYGAGPDTVFMVQLLLTEVIGQLEFEMDHGHFPDDQRDFGMRTYPLFEGYARRVVAEIGEALSIFPVKRRAA